MSMSVCVRACMCESSGYTYIHDTQYNLQQNSRLYLHIAPAAVAYTTPSLPIAW